MRWLKKTSEFIITYAAAIIVVLQIIGNMLFFFDKEFYIKNGFILNWAVGTNAFFPVVLFCMSYRLKFCRAGIICAGAEVLMALYYVIVQKDDIYNIIVQITLGLLAIMLTMIIYGRFKKGRVARFLYYAVTSNNCEEAVRNFVKNKN
jgi:Na+(H+)/acetate symporter ActP